MAIWQPWYGDKPRPSFSLLPWGIWGFGNLTIWIYLRAAAKIFTILSRPLSSSIPKSWTSSMKPLISFHHCDTIPWCDFYWQIVMPLYHWQSTMRHIKPGCFYRYCLVPTSVLILCQTAQQTYPLCRALDGDTIGVWFQLFEYVSLYLV